MIGQIHQQMLLCQIRYGTNADLKIALLAVHLCDPKQNVANDCEWLQAVLNNDLPIK